MKMKWEQQALLPPPTPVIIKSVTTREKMYKTRVRSALKNMSIFKKRIMNGEQNTIFNKPTESQE